MKNSKNIFLSVILGGLVLVTVIAGVVTMSVKNNSGEELKATEKNESLEEYLWATKASSEAETREDVRLEVQETVQETETAKALEETLPETEEVEEVLDSDIDIADAEWEQPVDVRPVAGTEVISLLFSETSRLSWPVEGSVILDYSMDTTVFFPTLKQYKCNPGILIQSEPGMAVSCPADALVNEVGYDDEIGGYVVMSLGNGYELKCGQLNEIGVCEGDYIIAGDVIGITAEPTEYYVVEGCNVYLELTKDDVPVDPLDFLE